MPRIIGIDYGGKRTGIAVTDSMQIIATALTTVPSNEVLDFLVAYVAKEEVEAMVIGYPISLKSEVTDGTKLVERFVEKLKTTFTTIQIHLIDERFTSRIAKEAMFSGGMKKKDRKVKGNVDMISAVIILQDFMSRNQ